MTLVKRKDSKNYYYEFLIDGKKYSRSTRTSNRTKALAVERKARNEVHAHLVMGESKTIELESAIKQHMTNRSQMKSYDTVQACCHRMMGFKLHPKTKEKIPLYGLDIKQELHKLTSGDLVRLVSERRGEGYSDQSIKHELSQLRLMIQLMSDLHYKTPQALKYPKMKKGVGRVRFLGDDEEKLFLMELKRGLNADNYDFAIGMLDTGARYMEMASLPWSRVDMDKRTVQIVREKVGNASTFHMTERLYKVMLKRWERRGKDRYVFMADDGVRHKQYSKEGLQRGFDRAGLNSDVIISEKGKATSHVLRHTFASRLVQAGMSLFKVGQLLGHTDVKTTQIYAHLVPEEASKQAVDILNQR